MPRKSRVVIPEVAHHIIQRGNNRQNVLERTEDFRAYCYWVNQYAQKYQVTILAYCLMNNHVHFVAVPQDRQGLSRLFNAAHMRYARYKNFKRGASGHLWQGRFYSCLLDEGHLFFAIRYVEQNPVRAGMVGLPWDYEWSSAKWHIGQPAKEYIKIKKIAIVDKKHWAEYLVNTDAAVDKQIRKQTYAGKACAGDTFINHWEKKLNCVLRTLKPGRKKINRVNKDRKEK
jgi:putative transposase